MNAVIAEDNRSFQKTLAELVNKWGINVLFCAESGEELLSYLPGHEIDLAFLDIGLPQVSGLEVARHIRTEYPRCEIIFITSHDEYIREAVELYAADYITKPMDTQRLQATLRRIQQKLASPSKILEISVGQEKHYLKNSDINFVEALRNKVIIHLPERQLEASHSLKEIQEMVGEGFFRTSRSFLVNLAKVTAIRPYSRTSYELTFAGEGRAVLSKRKYEEFRHRVKNGDNKGVG